MMRVRMLVGLSGPAIQLEPGDEHDFLAAEAIRLIDAGFAMPVTSSDIERAVAEPSIEQRKRGRPKNVVSIDGRGLGSGAHHAGRS